MKQAELLDMIIEKNPFIFRNNRGIATAIGKDGKKRYIRFGIPEPKTNEKEDALKGGDEIGWTEKTVTQDMVGQKIAVFTSIEAKTLTDHLKLGQIRWHNLVLEHGGISEIWVETPVGVGKITERMEEPR